MPALLHNKVFITVPQCESHSVEQVFALWFVKVCALCFVCELSQYTHFAGSLNKFAQFYLLCPDAFR